MNEGTAFVRKGYDNQDKCDSTLKRKIKNKEEKRKRKRNGERRENEAEKYEGIEGYNCNRDVKTEIDDDNEADRLVQRSTLSQNDSYYKNTWNKLHDNEVKGPRKEKTKDKLDKDEKLLDLVAYYAKILQTFEVIPDADKEMFVTNVLQESKGYEVKLAAHGSSSHCIELLLSICKDPDVLMQYMTSFANEKIEVCTNPNASHISELLLNIAFKNILNWSTILESEEESAEKKNASFFISWITDFGSFIMENFESCLGNQYACHVTCTVIHALGGDMSDASSRMSKRSANHKKDFRQQYVGKEEIKSKQPITPVVMDNIPKFFKKMLKKLTKALLKIDNVSDYVSESSSATVIETLLCILKKHIPKHCRRLVCGLTTSLFSKRNSDGIPLAFLHQNVSFVVENMFQAADEELQPSLWEDYVANCLEPLVMHHVGNFVLQRLFDVVENQDLFEKMSEEIGNLFEKILSSRHYGIFLSIAGACNRLKRQQGQFMKNIMQCLQCAEPEERQLSLVPLLLGLRVYDKFENSICLQGSLLVQAILKFQKPKKVVSSLLNMKPKELSYLACHTQGCHVFHAFFSSATVGEKNKDKLIKCLQPCLVTLACDRNGSMTLSRLWVLLSIKQKSIIAETFVKEEEQKTLQSNKNGYILLKKFSIFYFKKDFSKWKEIQNSLSHFNHHNKKS